VRRLGVILVFAFLFLATGLLTFAATTSQGGDLTLAQARASYDQGVLFVDARTQATYDYLHIKGALLFYANAIEVPEFVIRLEKDAPVVVYCGSKKCHMSSILAKRLAKMGFKRIFKFEGGIRDWNEANYPMEGTALGPKTR